MYNGFGPAVTYSACGMALWVVSRNALERAVPNPEPGSAWRHWKHFLCGGLAGVFVQLPTFPFDTLKKRLQACCHFCCCHCYCHCWGLHRSVTIA